MIICFFCTVNHISPTCLSKRNLSIFSFSWSYTTLKNIFHAGDILMPTNGRSTLNCRKQFTVAGDRPPIRNLSQQLATLNGGRVPPCQAAKRWCGRGRKGHDVACKGHRLPRLRWPDDMPKPGLSSIAMISGSVDGKNDLGKPCFDIGVFL